MSRRVVAVQLASGAVCYVLVQNIVEFLDMQDQLSTLGEGEELSRLEKTKRGLAIKMAASVCDELGTLVHINDAHEFLLTLSKRDAYRVVDQINKNNSLEDAEIEDTEKKT